MKSCIGKMLIVISYIIILIISIISTLNYQNQNPEYVTITLLAVAIGTVGIYLLLLEEKSKVKEDDKSEVKEDDKSENETD